MEVFKANSCSDETIDLTTEAQLETLLKCIKDSEEVMIRWTDDDDKKCSKILITESLMVRVKDGRLSLTSTEEEED